MSPGAAAAEAAAPHLSPADLSVDHELMQLASGIDFILEVTPIDAQAARDGFLGDRAVPPVFAYRDPETSPEILAHRVARVPVEQVEDDTLRAVLEEKRRELGLQVRMLGCRETEEFRELAVELYGGVDDEHRERAEELMARVPRPAKSGPALDAQAFLELANAEIDAYKEQQPDVAMHAEIRDGVNGVMVSGDTLLIGPRAHVQQARANALIQHEIGTHLVTQVNGSTQAVKCLGAGLAGYDETQEGLAVLAEIACGQLTASRLRQLAARVLTVDRMLAGRSFGECYGALTSAGFGVGSAFTTTMRVFRSGGLPKDACYLRGVLALLEKVRAGESLELLFRGKFSLADEGRIAELESRGLLAPVLLRPRWLDEEGAAERLIHAARAECLAEVLAPDAPETAESE